MNRISLTCGTISSGSTCNSVQLSHSVMSDSLQPHGLQHARPPCQLPTPGVYSKSCPLSLWCNPVISSSVVALSSCLQSFSASGSFQMSRLFASGGQSIGALASASVLPMNDQGWFPLGLTGFLSLQSKELKSLLQHHSSKASILGAQLSLWSYSQIHTWLLKKPQLWLDRPL